MGHATTYTTQVVTPFGSGYDPESHGDTRWNLGSDDLDEMTVRFGKMMKSLRSSLSLGGRAR